MLFDKLFVFTFFIILDVLTNLQRTSSDQAGCQWVSFQISCDFDAFTQKITTYLTKTKNIQRTLTLKQLHLIDLLKQKAKEKIEKGSLPVISVRRYCIYATSCMHLIVLDIKHP
jgi:hypothetical protein